MSVNVICKWYNAGPTCFGWECILIQGCWLLWCRCSRILRGVTMGRAFAFTLPQPHTFVKGQSGKNYLFSSISRSQLYQLYPLILTALLWRKKIYKNANYTFKNVTDISVSSIKSVLPKVVLKWKKKSCRLVIWSEKFWGFYGPFLLFWGRRSLW